MWARNRHRVCVIFWHKKKTGHTRQEPLPWTNYRMTRERVQAEEGDDNPALPTQKRPARCVSTGTRGHKRRARLMCHIHVHVHVHVVGIDPGRASGAFVQTICLFAPGLQRPPSCLRCAPSRLHSGGPLLCLSKYSPRSGAKTFAKELLSLSTKSIVVMGAADPMLARHCLLGTSQK